VKSCKPKHQSASSDSSESSDDRGHLPNGRGNGARSKANVLNRTSDWVKNSDQPSVTPSNGGKSIGTR
jgi:hypothetical protein